LTLLKEVNADIAAIGAGLRGVAVCPYGADMGRMPGKF
jgi:hypothetical protein